MTELNENELDSVNGGTFTEDTNQKDSIGTDIKEVGAEIAADFIKNSYDEIKNYFNSHHDAESAGDNIGSMRY